MVTDVHWNHRVIRDVTEEDHSFGIYEVHYRGDRPAGFGEPVRLMEFLDDENPLDGLQWTLEHAATALEKPVLIWDGKSLKEDAPGKYREVTGGGEDARALVRINMLTNEWFIDGVSQGQMEVKKKDD